MPQKKDALERIGTITLVSLFVGLAAWHGGGSSAIERIHDVWVLTVASVLYGVAAIVYCGVQGHREGGKGLRGGLALGAGFVVCTLLVAWSAVGLVNQALDMSAPTSESALVGGTTKPWKEPTRVRVTWRGNELRIRSSAIFNCSEGQRATVVVRRGALGLAWVEKVECAPAPAAPK